jgi:hypothetical protein
MSLQLGRQDFGPKLTIDATYKTNAHKMSLVNIVGTSNVSSIKVGNNCLQTFAIAAAFVNSETDEDLGRTERSCLASR